MKNWDRSSQLNSGYQFSTTHQHIRDSVLSTAATSPPAASQPPQTHGGGGGVILSTLLWGVDRGGGEDIETGSVGGPHIRATKNGATSVPKFIDLGGRLHPVVNNFPLSHVIFKVNFPLSNDPLAYGVIWS